MNIFIAFILAIVSSMLIDNVVLSRFYGICPFLGVSKKLTTAVGMSVAVTFVMVLATAVTFPIYTYILVPAGMEYLQTVLFILIIAGLVQLVEIILKKYIPSLYNSLGIYLPLITTNCAVLGVTMLVLQKVDSTTLYDYTFLHAIVNALGAGIGFLVAMVLFAGVRGRLEKADIPKSLKGLPITLVAAALTSLSFLGFAGFVDKLIPLA